MNRLESMRVADVMHEGVFTCSLHAPLSTVARIMAAHRVHAVVVWNEPSRNEPPQVWGVVSDLDLIKIAGVEDTSERTAGESAATPALRVARDETLARAAQLMAEHDVSHLVVIDRHTAKPVGVISTLDLADVLAVTDPVLA